MTLGSKEPQIPFHLAWSMGWCDRGKFLNEPRRGAGATQAADCQVAVCTGPELHWEDLGSRDLTAVLDVSLRPRPTSPLPPGNLAPGKTRVISHPLCCAPLPGKPCSSAGP